MSNDAPLPQPAPVSGLPSKGRFWRWLGLALLGVGVIVGSSYILRQTAQNGNAQTVGDAKSNPNLFVG